MTPTADIAPPAPTGLAAAAIVDDADARGGRLLVDTVRGLQRAGWHIRGLLPVPPAESRFAATHGTACMVLADAASGEEFLVSQAMGQQARACRADPRGFAQASQALRLAPGTPADLVVSNRFGRLESEGSGFTAELLQLMGDGLPLLTVVPQRLVAHWLRFTGEGRVLSTDPAEVQAWVASLGPPGLRRAGGAALPRG